jgi:Kef-type K+ transport system membrane component KefB
LFSLSHHPAATQGDTQTTMLLALPFYAWTGVTALLGVALGAAAAALLGNEFRRDESWGVLLGIGLAAAGLATRVGLSSLMTMFTMGLAISMISAHRRALSQMIAPTEQAVLLPLLLVAGARLDLTSFRSLPVLVIAAVALRLVFVLGVGTGLRHWVAAAKDVRSSLGLSLLPAGGISVGIGLLFSLRFPGAVGDTVLAAAAACTLLGEAVGTRALRGILETADEAFSADDTGAPPAVSMIPDRLSSVPELSREPSFPEASLETESPKSTSSLTGDDS